MEIIFVYNNMSFNLYLHKHEGMTFDCLSNKMRINREPESMLWRLT